jgi:polyhydroxyalkanoate synthase
VKFCLAASGHIAGVVNPPGAGKYGHWENTKLPKAPDEWLNTAKYDNDSWWPSWEKWVGKYAGGDVPARQPGDGKLKPLEPAPGSYVKVKAS